MQSALIDRAFESYERWTAEWDTGRAANVPETDPVLSMVERLHRLNFDLWTAEDFARRTDVSDALICECKRTIDQLNQRRNDAIESIDVWLLHSVYNTAPDPGAALRTETPGSVFDRLSILSLKIVRMGEQAGRRNSTPDHRASCERRVAVLLQQRDELRAAFRLLVAELNTGAVRMRVYRQFKMYNDPNLNPCLYGARPESEVDLAYGIAG
jgi:Protein of unknown function (DUF4254)